MKLIPLTEEEYAKLESDIMLRFTERKKLEAELEQLKQAEYRATIKLRQQQMSMSVPFDDIIEKLDKETSVLSTYEDRMKKLTILQALDKIVDVSYDEIMKDCKPERIAEETVRAIDRAWAITTQNIAPDKVWSLNPLKMDTTMTGVHKHYRVGELKFSSPLMTFGVNCTNILRDGDTERCIGRWYETMQFSIHYKENKPVAISMSPIQKTYWGRGKKKYVLQLKEDFHPLFWSPTKNYWDFDSKAFRYAYTSKSEILGASKTINQIDMREWLMTNVAIISNISNWKWKP